MVPADSPIQTLADIKGKTFSFVDPASTSGYLVPSYTLLTKANLMNNRDFKSIFAGSHPASYQAIVNKKVDAGAVASDVFGQGIAQGTIDKNKVRIIDTSFDIIGSPMGIRADIAQPDQDVLLQTFLSINDQPKDSALIRNFVLSSPDGKGGFGVGTVKLVKGDDHAFDDLRKIPAALGLDITKLGG
jgi:phosphonate transport system substrate-binding protein